MRRRAMVAALVLVAPLGGTSAGAAGEQGVAELAVGSGDNRLAEVGPPVSLTVAAHRSSDGRVVGHARGSGELFPGGTFQVEGEVTCLRVEPKLGGGGLRASIKYRFHRSAGSAAPPQGGGVEVFVEDNGQPVGGDPVDANATGPPLDPVAFEASDPSDCDDPNVAGQPYNPVDSGDYTLGDGD